jgi:Protein-arginine deiminase (PAD)
MKTIIISSFILAAAFIQNAFAISSAFKNIEEVRLTSNLSLPTVLVASYLEKNGEYLNFLNEIVGKLNQERKSNQPKLSFLISVPDNYGYDSFGSNTKRPSGEPAEKYGKWLKALKSPTEILTVFDKGMQNPWMQDVGEAILVRERGQAVMKPAFLDTNYHGGMDGSQQAVAFSELLQIPVFNAQNYEPSQVPNDGDRGGNIEVTHEGRALLGSNASPRLVALITEITKKPPILVDTGFLLVGHVDEIFSFVPSSDACGAALVYADPLQTINLVWTSAKKYEDIGITRNRESIQYLLKSSALKKSSLGIEDFDLTKPVRKDSEEHFYGDWIMLRNLKAAISIKSSIATIQSSSKCLKTIIGLPTVFELPPEFELAEFENNEKALAPLGSAINMLVLRDHAVIANPFFKDVVLSQLKKAFSEKNIHVVQPSMVEYLLGYGSVHCSTNVIRR